MTRRASTARVSPVRRSLQTPAPPTAAPVDLSTAVYLKFSQLATYLGYFGKRGRNAAREFVERRQLPKFWRGGAWLVKRADVDAALEGRVSFRGHGR